MRGAIILAVGLLSQLTLTGQTPVSPAPAASPLKEIIDVKSRALCTALRDNVAVSLAGLISNDANIDIGRKAMTKLGADQIKGSTAGKMDSLVAENVVGSIVHNLVLIDQKLDDPQRFPADPKTDDERLAAQVKAQLKAIEEAQKRQLNALNGTAETDTLNNMQHDTYQYGPIVMNSTATTSTAPPATNISDAGLRDAPGTPKKTDPRTLAAGNLIGTTYYGSLAGQMESLQLATATLESAAATTIRQAATECAGAPHQP